VISVYTLGAATVVAVTARTAGEWVVFTAAVLGGLVAIFSIMRRYVFRPLGMAKRQVDDTWEFAKTGDQRMHCIETQIAELRQAVVRMAEEMAQVPDLAKSVAILADKVATEVTKAGDIHDQLMARDEELASQHKQIVTALEQLTPPHGQPAVPPIVEGR
jgi:hypothetical protein